MSGNDADRLRQHGIAPSAQRVAVAGYVLHTDDHPSADAVRARVRQRFPNISRATVYNALNLFVARGLLRKLVLGGGGTVFDPNMTAHHHFIDDRSGRIYDVPLGAIQIAGVPELHGFEAREYQVVIRGSKRTPTHEPTL